MDHPSSFRFGRRAAIQAAIGAAGFQALSRAEQSKSRSASNPPGTPVVETAAGKVRGFTSSGVAVFLGVPYGASTTGANRFMPPVKPQPWTGVRNCLNYGHSCPQAGTGVI